MPMSPETTTATLSLGDWVISAYAVAERVKRQTQGDDAPAILQKAAARLGMTVDQLIALTGDGQVRPARQRHRKPTLASVAKQAAKAGIPVARFEVEQGKIIVVPGKTSGDDDAATTINEWDIK